MLKDKLADGNMFRPEIDDLIITSGAQQGNELSCKVLLNEGDTLICEAPSFIGSINSFKSYNVNLVGVELESDGINIEKLEEAIKNNKNVKVLYLIPNFQNPTGQTMSFEKRVKVLELARKYNFVIIEDNPYGDLRFAERTFLQLINGSDGHVIIQEVSQGIAPGLRVGYVSAPKILFRKLLYVSNVRRSHKYLGSGCMS